MIRCFGVIGLFGHNGNGVTIRIGEQITRYSFPRLYGETRKINLLGLL